MEDCLHGYLFRDELYYKAFTNGVQQDEYMHTSFAHSYVCLLEMQFKLVLCNDYSLLNYKKQHKDSVICSAENVKLNFSNIKIVSNECIMNDFKFKICDW